MTHDTMLLFVLLFQEKTLKQQRVESAPAQFGSIQLNLQNAKCFE